MKHVQQVCTIKKCIDEILQSRATTKTLKGCNVICLLAFYVDGNCQLANEISSSTLVEEGED